MATTAYASAFAGVPPARRKAPISAFAKRLVNAIAVSRMRAAEAELRRHGFIVGETVLTQGEYRAIGLGKADLLPFNT
jgi:hypothetical protein